MQASRHTAPAYPVHRIVASFALLSALLGCGYKGPLYMPPPPPPDQSLTTPPAPPSVPAPQPSGNAGEAAMPSAVQPK